MNNLCFVTVCSVVVYDKEKFTMYIQKQVSAQKKEASTAASVLDASSQGESLQRKVDLANNAVQRVDAPRLNNTGLPLNNYAASFFPLQLRANVKITKPESAEDDDEYVVAKLGQGSFGMSFETNKKNVVKCNNPSPKKNYFQGPRLCRKKEDEKSPTEKEYDLLEAMYKSGAPVVRPYGFGKILVDETREPNEFDKIFHKDQECFLMDKINILSDPLQRTKDGLDVKTIVENEFSIFKNLMLLREKIIETGFYHGDIKHNNVGYNREGKLVAIDVGVSGKIEKGTAPRMWSKNMCEKGCLFSFLGWQDDVAKSFLLTVRAIETRLGVSKPQSIENNIFPYPFRNSFLKYRITEFDKGKTDYQEHLKENINNLEKALCEYFSERIKNRLFRLYGMKKVIK